MKLAHVLQKKGGMKCHRSRGGGLAIWILKSWSKKLHQTPLDEMAYILMVKNHNPSTRNWIGEKPYHHD